MSTEELQKVTDWREIVADNGEIVIGEIIGEGIPYKPCERLRRHKRERVTEHDPFNITAQFKHSALGLN